MEAHEARAEEADGVLISGHHQNTDNLFRGEIERSRHTAETKAVHDATTAIPWRVVCTGARPNSALIAVFDLSTQRNLPMLSLDRPRTYSCLVACVLACALAACTPEEGSPDGGGEGGSAGTAGESGSGGAGSGGASGSGATGGSAGDAGSGGTAGSAGEGGSAGSAGTGGTSGDGGTGGNAGTGGIVGEPHTVTPMAGSIVLDDEGTIVGRITWSTNAVTQDTTIGIREIALPQGAPTALEPVAGFAVDLGGAEVRLTLSFVVPSDADAMDYLLLEVRDDGPRLRDVSISTVMGETRATFGQDVADDVEYSLVRVNPAPGCDQTHPGGDTLTNDEALEALAHVYRVVTGVSISGSGVTTLASLDCLLVIGGGLNIQSTALVDATVPNLIAQGTQYAEGSGGTITSNQQLESISLPALYVTASAISANPLLESVSMPALVRSDISIINNGAAAITTTFDASALRQSSSVTFSNNPALRNLDGLGNLERASHLSVSSCDQLEHIDGLSHLTQVGRLVIDETGVEQTNGLSALATAHEVLISANPVLASIVLPALRLVDTPSTGDGELNVHNNGVLRELSADAMEELVTLSIEGNGGGLAPLVMSFASLTHVDSLSIAMNGGLRDLQGLSALTTANLVGITNNSRLQTLAGLEHLTEATAITIQTNALLTDATFDALTRITESGGLGVIEGLRVNGNNALQTLSLPVLATNPGEISIAMNGVLTSASVPQLRAGNTITINYNGSAAAPLDIDMSMLTTTTGAITLNYNAGLRDMDGFGALRSVGGAFSIGQNVALTQVDGLSALTTVNGALSIGGNTALTDVDGLSALQRCGGLSINNSAAITRVVLPALTTISGGIGLGLLPRLAEVSLDGVSSIESFSLVTCSAMATNLDVSSASLQTVTGQFMISAALRLTDLDGFPSLSRVQSYSVQNNTMLPTCEAVALRDQILAANPINSSYILGNLADTCMP